MPRPARPSASISSTRLASIALITAAHLAVSASENHSRSTGSPAMASAMRWRPAGLRASAAPPMAKPATAAASSHQLALNHTPRVSTAAASHGKSLPSSSKLPNCGTTNRNTSSTAATPATMRMAG